MIGLALQKLRTAEFRTEWCVVAATIVADAVWAQAIGFHLVMGWTPLLVIAGIAAVYGAVRVFCSERFGLLAEYFCLSLAGSASLLVFLYLSLTSAPGPLVDTQLLAADRALGFDWPSLYRALMAQDGLAAAGKLIYDSLLIQGLYCTLLLSLMQQREQMKELWRLTFTASVMCCLIGMLLPALGPYKIFGLESQGLFLPDMEHLLSHRDLNFSLGAMTGVVCFPSLHTAMALAYPYGLRRTGLIFHIFVGLNILMLFTIPFFGGHYLVDMIAGAAVMLVALAIARLSVFGWAKEKARGARLAESPA
jgi:hypothetical protein